MRQTPEHPNRALQLLPGIFLLGLLIAGFIVSISALDRFAVPDSFQEVLSGRATAAFEADYNDKLPFRQWGINTWGAIEYALFKEGREGVIVGQDGWLFSDEEFAYYPEEEAELKAKLAFVEAVQERLEASGTELIVALLPAKARVYEEKLGRYTLPGYTRGRYERFRETLEAQGVHAPDLLAVLLETKQEHPVFVRTDTHWTVVGAEAVAATLADAAASLGLELPQKEYLTRETDEALHEGDLLKFVPGADWVSKRLQNELVEQRETEAVDDTGLGLFDDVIIPVALVGTSYSADQRWNFEGALKQHLKADVLNVAEQGEGPFLPMADYLTSEIFAADPADLVIWEIPERFLPVDYNLEAF